MAIVTVRYQQIGSQDTWRVVLGAYGGLSRNWYCVLPRLLRCRYPLQPGQDPGRWMRSQTESHGQHSVVCGCSQGFWDLLRQALLCQGLCLCCFFIYQMVVGALYWKVRLSVLRNQVLVLFKEPRIGDQKLLGAQRLRSRSTQEYRQHPGTSCTSGLVPSLCWCSCQVLCSS